MNAIKKLLIGALLAVVATHAFAQNDDRRATLGAAATIAGPAAAGLLVAPTLTTAHWTTIMAHQWTYPWKGLFGPQGFGSQTINAGVKYWEVKIDPSYFNETWTAQGSPLKHGTHTIEADSKVQHSAEHRSRSAQGRAVVGCIMLSAVGVITASVVKASALGNPPRWRSQAEHERILASGAEKKYELTTEEAVTSTALCGLGAVYVSAQYLRRQ